MDQGKHDCPRPCPVCRTAMIGEKMRLSSRAFYHIARLWHGRPPPAPSSSNLPPHRRRQAAQAPTQQARSRCLTPLPHSSPPTPPPRPSRQIRRSPHPSPNECSPKTTCPELIPINASRLARRIETAFAGEFAQWSANVRGDIRGNARSVGSR
jgi:hypothetical protein